MTIATSNQPIKIPVFKGLFSNISKQKPIYVGSDVLSKPNNLFEYIQEQLPTRPFIDLDADDASYTDQSEFQETHDVILGILENHELFSDWSIIEASHFNSENWRKDPKTWTEYLHNTKPKLSYRLTCPNLIANNMKDLKEYIEEFIEPQMEDMLGEYMKKVKIDYSVYSTRKFSCVNNFKHPQQSERIRRLVKGSIEDTFIQGLNGKEELIELLYDSEEESDTPKEEEKQPEPKPQPKPKPLKKVSPKASQGGKTLTKRKVPLNETETYSLQDKHVDLLMGYMKNPDTITFKDFVNVGLVLKNNDYPLKLFYDWGQLNDIWKKENAKNAPACWEGFHSRHYPFEVIYKIAKEHSPEKWKEWKLKHLSTNNTIPVADLKKGENSVLKHILPELRKKVKYTQKRFYILNDFNLWIRSDNCTYLLVTTIHKYIDNSIAKIALDLDRDDLHEEERKRLREERDSYTSQYKSTNKSSFTSQIEKQLKTVLHDTSFYEKLDSQDGIIAFKNGVYDLEMGQLRDIFSTDYLSETLDYNYIKSTEEDRELVKQDILKICNNNPQHLEYYLSIIGQSFTGLAHKEK